MARSTSRRGARRRPGVRRAVAARMPRRRKPAQTATVALADALATIVDDLASAGVEFALVGGLAVSARAEPRLTRDVDLAIAAEDDAAAEEVVNGLVSRGYQIRGTVQHIKTGRLATARLASRVHSALIIDLLFASSGIEAEVVAAAQRLEILPKLRVPVARAGHLIAMKRLARDDRERPQDLDDIRALLEVASVAERRLVDTAIALIAKRGYARGRDLVAAWRHTLKQR